ncbi:uncharacterized protein LOC129456351 [Periophthalmus magnuspinnatus]|uniref:uncharacterized protein LOC129456351 n=1 Tax=Periophthalmus magnuspinnatus TaxID=409849 RepID=UPI0024374402|nr:uncharacterized protein LOC129456351 [Periophthalmus magnuspinnatus]
MGPACSEMMIMKMILLLWFSSGPVQTFTIKQIIWYKPYPRTWMDAQAYCKSEHNADLATVTENDVNVIDMSIFYSWIGLRKSGSQWYWDKGNGDTQAVQDNFVLPVGNRECGQALYSTHIPLDDDCENIHFFFCRMQGLLGVLDIFIPKTKTWEEAKQYCVEHNFEFITVTSDKDLQWSSSPFYVARNFPVWIGLYHYDYCGTVWSQNKTFSDQSCSETFPYLCSVNNLLLVQELLTWEQSYDRCKIHIPHTHFSSYQLLGGDAFHLQFIQFLARNATTDKVWLGLRFMNGFWFWSNGEIYSLPDLPSCPEPHLHCGALVVNRKSSISKPIIEPSDCSETLNLLCYGL